MKRMLKSTLAICLVLMMALSTIVVSATTETETAELTTVYTQDFTTNSTPTGWINQSAWTNSTSGRTDIIGGQLTFYEEDLGDNFKINSTLGYGYNGIEFIINGDGTNANVGVKVRQGKGNYSEDFVEGDAAHEAAKEAGKSNYSYTIEIMDVYVNGAIPTDWKTLVYVEEQDKDRAEVKKYENNGAIINIRNTNLEYKTEYAEISYNDGALSFNVNSDPKYNETRSFTYDVTQGGTVAPAANKGYFGIKTDSGGAWLYNIEIQKELSNYITLYEQDFTAEGATVEGWSLVDMALSAGEGIKANNTTTGAMVFDRELGNNWRVSGSVNRGYNGEIYMFNSDAKVESGVLTYSKGYKIQQNKNIGTSVSKITSASNTTTVMDWNNVPTDTYQTFDFQIINNNGKVQYIYSLNGNIYTNYEFDMTSYTNGKFAIIEDADTLTIKNIKIEVIPDDYVTLYEQDFTAEGLTIEEIEGSGIDLTSGATVATDNGLTLTNSGEALVIKKDIGRKYRVSGRIKARCWQDEVMTQWNTHYKLYLNSDASIVNDELSVANAYRIDVNKDCNEMTLLVDGQEGYSGFSYYWFWRNEDTKHTSVNNVFVDFEIESDGNNLTYVVTSIDGATQYVNQTVSLADKSAYYNGEYRKLALLNFNDNSETSIQNLKIEVISDYAVDDVEAYEKSNGNVKYSAIVHNNSGNPVTGAVLVAAAYDADKNLIGATVIDDYTGAVGKELVDGEIEIEEGETADEVVIYFWDNFDSAYPLYEQTTIEL